MPVIIAAPGKIGSIEPRFLRLIERVFMDDSARSSGGDCFSYLIKSRIDTEEDVLTTDFGMQAL